MRTKQILLYFLLMMIAVFGQGCVVAAVGAGAAGTIAYIRGDLESIESENIDKVYDAALQAAEELELRIISKSKDALSATIVARDAQDKKVQIKLQTKAENTTKLSIRIGTFGSETKSRLIYQKIYDNLKN
jgi:endo-beta-N-acetylglucosaminidase D